MSARAPLLPSHGLCFMTPAEATGYLGRRGGLLLQEARLKCDRMRHVRQTQDRCALFWLGPIWLSASAMRLPLACTPSRSGPGLVLRSQMEKGSLGAPLGLGHRLYEQVAFCEDALRAHGAMWLWPLIEEQTIRGAWGREAVDAWKGHQLQMKAKQVARVLGARWAPSSPPPAGAILRF